MAETVLSAAFATLGSGSIRRDSTPGDRPTGMVAITVLVAVSLFAARF